MLDHSTNACKQASDDMARSGRVVSDFSESTGNVAYAGIVLFVVQKTGKVKANDDDGKDASNDCNNGDGNDHDDKDDDGGNEDDSNDHAKKNQRRKVKTIQNE